MQTSSGSNESNIQLGIAFKHESNENLAPAETIPEAQSHT